jgi:hypothetical protein
MGRQKHDAARPPDAQLPAGWLTKQGGFRTSWRRRWFAFDESADSLQYFEAPPPLSSSATSAHTPPSEESLVLRGSIAVASMLRVAPASNADDHQLSLHAFEICTPRRRYLIRADTAAEQARWVAALRDVSGRVRAERQHELDVLRSLELTVCGSVRKAGTDPGPAGAEYDFTAYKVRVSPCANASCLCGAQPWLVQKRYSEFRALATALESAGEIAPLPPLPPTKWFANTDPAVIRERRAGLQTWLQGVTQALHAPPPPARLKPTGSEDKDDEDAELSEDLAERVTWSMVAENESESSTEGASALPEAIPHISLTFLHAFLETPPAVLATGSAHAAPTRYAVGFSPTKLGPIAARAVAAARSYSSMNDDVALDAEDDRKNLSEILCDCDGDPIYLKQKQKQQPRDNTWKRSSWVGIYYDLDKGTPRLGGGAAGCCDALAKTPCALRLLRVLAWLALLALLLLAAGATACTTSLDGNDGSGGTIEKISPRFGHHSSDEVVAADAATSSETTGGTMAAPPSFAANSSSSSSSSSSSQTNGATAAAAAAAAAAGGGGGGDVGDGDGGDTGGAAGQTVSLQEHACDIFSTQVRAETGTATISHHSHTRLLCRDSPFSVLFSASRLVCEAHRRRRHTRYRAS